MAPVHTISTESFLLSFAPLLCSRSGLLSLFWPGVCCPRYHPLPLPSVLRSRSSNACRFSDSHPSGSGSISRSTLLLSPSIALHFFPSLLALSFFGRGTHLVLPSLFVGGVPASLVSLPNSLCARDCGWMTRRSMAHFPRAGGTTISSWCVASVVSSLVLTCCFTHSLCMRPGTFCLLVLPFLVSPCVTVRPASSLFSPSDLPNVCLCVRVVPGPCAGERSFLPSTLSPCRVFARRAGAFSFLLSPLHLFFALISIALGD